MLLLLSLLLYVVSGTELTFELEDNARQCFHEVLKKGLKTTLEYQVRWKFLPFVIRRDMAVDLCNA